MNTSANIDVSDSDNKHPSTNVELSPMVSTEKELPAGIMKSNAEGYTNANNSHLGIPDVLSKAMLLNNNGNANDALIYEKIQKIMDLKIVPRNSIQSSDEDAQHMSPQHSILSDASLRNNFLIRIDERAISKIQKFMKDACKITIKKPNSLSYNEPQEDAIFEKGFELKFNINGQSFKKPAQYIRTLQSVEADMMLTNNIHKLYADEKKSNDPDSDSLSDMYKISLEGTLDEEELKHSLLRNHNTITEDCTHSSMIVSALKYSCIPNCIRKTNAITEMNNDNPASSLFSYSVPEENQDTSFSLVREAEKHVFEDILPRMKTENEEQERSLELCTVEKPEEDAKPLLTDNKVNELKTLLVKNLLQPNPTSTSGQILFTTDEESKKQKIEKTQDDEKKYGNADENGSTIPDVTMSQSQDQPLQDTWTLWLFQHEKDKRWEDMHTEICSFNTMTDFWKLYYNIKEPRDLDAGIDVSIFRKNIKPLWEDKVNINAGRWVFTVDNASYSNANKLWLDTLMILLGENIKCSKYICGIVLTVRLCVFRISVWISNNANNRTVLQIGKHLKDILGLRIRYQLHRDAMTFNPLPKWTYII